MNGQKIKEQVLSLFMPQGVYCLCCGCVRAVDRRNGLCLACETALNACRPPENACPRCLLPLEKDKCVYCKNHPLPAIDAFYAPFMYYGTVRLYLHALKYGHALLASNLLGREMAASLAREDFDIIVPVPMHRSRLRERGRNHAQVLAQTISEITGIPMVLALRRLRSTKTQSRLPVEQRASNVARAFKARVGMTGMRVLLVDDIRTTGATAEACAEALLEQGAARCCLVTSAITPRKNMPHPDGEVF